MNTLIFLCYKHVTKSRKLIFIKGKTSPENTSLTSVKWWIQNWILCTNVYLLPCNLTVILPLPLLLPCYFLPPCVRAADLFLRPLKMKDNLPHCVRAADLITEKKQRHSAKTPLRACRLILWSSLFLWAPGMKEMNLSPQFWGLTYVQAESWLFSPPYRPAGNQRNFAPVSTDRNGPFSHQRTLSRKQVSWHWYVYLIFSFCTL